MALDFGTPQPFWIPPNPELHSSIAQREERKKALKIHLGK